MSRNLPKLLPAMSFLLGLSGLLSAQTPATVTLSASANSAIFGQPVTLSASVTPAQATGRITFYDGSTVIGAADLDNGRASITALLPFPGSRSLTAQIANSTGLRPASSPVLRLSANPVPASTLQAGSSYATTSTINQHVAVADFNGDGHPDIITNTYNVLFGNGDGTFRAPVVYSSSRGAIAVTTGDFNGDGKPDFAATDGYGSIEIWLNKGDGTFATPALIATTVAPIDIAAADFNHDGILDLAIASRQGQNTGIGVLLGNGDGTFRPLKTFLPNQPETALAIADVNADGNPDIIAVDSDDISNNVTILLGAGDGTFRTSASYASAFPRVIAVADFNRDGKPDFAVTGYNSNNISIFLGNGDGTFTHSSQNTATPGAAPVSIKLAAADFDGDGIPDLALATDSKSGISVFIGKGDGTFRGAVNFPSGSAPGSLIAAEFNGDGRTDLAVTNSSSIQILLGAAGSFPTVSTTSVPTARGGVPYSDTLTASGGTTPYTWTVSAGSVPGLSVSANGVIGGTPPTGTLSTPTASNTYLFSVVVSGPNGPGFYSSQALALTLLPAFQINTGAASVIGKVGVPFSAQLIASGGTGPFVNWKVVSGSLPPGLGLDPASGVISGTPTQSGNFSVTITVDDSTGLTSLPAQIGLLVDAALSVLNASLADGFVGAPYYVALHGSGGFPPYRNWTVASGTLPPGLALDAASGVISGTPTTAAGSPFAFTITFGDGTGVSAPQAFTIHVATPGPVPISLSSSANPSALGQPVTLTATLPSSSTKVTFYDGANVLGSSAITNGKAQITTNLLGAGLHNLSARFFAPSASATLNQTVSASPDVSFAPAALYAAGIASSDTLPIVADFNRDGKPDIATIAYINNSISITILPGNGDGTFGKAVVNPAPAGVLSFLVADFNEDGIPDLVLNDVDGIEIWLGNGDGTFRTLFEVQQPSRIAAFVTADFNLDGHSDLILLGGSNQCAVLLGMGDGTFRPAITVSAGLNAASGTVGDFNGDGIPDLVVADSTGTGKVNVLPGKGDGSFGSPLTLIASVTPGNTNYGPPLVTAADFNADGVSDLIVAGSASDRFTVFLGRGNGTFAPPIDTQTGGAYVRALAIADVNGDGINDIVTGGTSSIGVFPGKGDGTFRAATATAAGGQATQFAAGDFNGDGRTDVAFNTNKGTVNVLLGSASAGDQLSLSPAVVNIQANFPSNPAQSVTLTLQTDSSAPPPFSATFLGGYVYASPTPASGTMTLASSSAGRYTWTAQVNIAFSLNGTGNVFSEEFQFAAGNAVALLPITVATGQYPQTTGIVNAAAGGQAKPSVVAPGSYIALYGSNLSGPALSATTLPLPATLNNTTITLGGIKMPLLYAASGQVNAIVPQGLAANGNYPLAIQYGYSQSATIWLAVTELQPAIYTIDASGSGAGVFANATTGKLITPSNPAQAGDYLVIYGTGFGPVTGANGEAPPADGAAAPLSVVYHTKAAIQATIGGIDAPVLFSGLTPTLASLYQVNIQVPSGVQPGGSVPVVITATDPQTGAIGQSNTVTIAVK